MSQEQWTAVDRYITDSLIPPDPVLDAVLSSMAAADLPQIAISPAQGKLLLVLSQLVNARSILEIGTLGGYSTIWLARSLSPGGRVVTLEADPKHADVARANFTRAGLEGSVELRLGKALDTLPKLAAESRAPFDLIFIDADKPNVPEYFRWAIQLSRAGGLIVVDNVVRDGAVIDAADKDPDTQGVRRLYEDLARDTRVVATAIQTVGVKGYDGFMLARVAG